MSARVESPEDLVRRLDQEALYLVVKAIVQRRVEIQKLEERALLLAKRLTEGDQDLDDEQRVELAIRKALAGWDGIAEQEA